MRGVDYGFYQEDCECVVGGHPWSGLEFVPARGGKRERKGSGGRGAVVVIEGKLNGWAVMNSVTERVQGRKGLWKG